MHVRTKQSEIKRLNQHKPEKDKLSVDVVLESGDLLIFGGKCRRVGHCVSQIQYSVRPANLPLTLGRLNVTLRCDPETVGRLQGEAAQQALLHALNPARPATSAGVHASAHSRETSDAVTEIAAAGIPDSDHHACSPCSARRATGSTPKRLPGPGDV